jgi:uncharacterized protein (TIGR02271 family)
MTGFGMVNLKKRATELQTKDVALPTLSDPAVRDDVIEVIEEELEVGKESVERGRMRIYNVVTEQEVTKDVGLRDETIRVTRRPVNRTVTVDPNLFQARSFEMVEVDEIAKVAKVARVVEEVYLGKEVSEKVETIKETLRRQDVEIEEIAAVRAYGDYEAGFKKFYNEKLASTGIAYDKVTPALRFGYALATTEPFRSSPWSAVKADAKPLWEEKNPGTWDDSQAVIKYAWETVRNAR